MTIWQGLKDGFLFPSQVCHLSRKREAGRPFGLRPTLRQSPLKPLVGVRFVTKFTSTFNRRVEKFFRMCCCCNFVRPRLLVAHHLLGVKCMSKRVGTASTQDKSETGSGKKRRRADWSPLQPGEEFSYTFTVQEFLRLSANDML